MRRKAGEPGTTANANSSKPHYGYIDCIRGYAVLMVMISHYVYLFPNLPYLVHRIATMGWYGVQLFFITSCLTLLMSWDYETRTQGRADASAFFIRRFFRIAPAYYVGGALYLFVLPTVGRFHLVPALAAMAFVNTWLPLLTPAVAGRWVAAQGGWSVPGGWSVEVEFVFYLLFPWFAAFVRSIRSACLVLLAAVVIGVVANRAALGALNGFYSPVAVQNFLFFWFPNEASVFASGGILYFGMRHLEQHGSVTDLLRYPTVLALVAIACFFSLAFLPLGKFLGDRHFLSFSLAVCLPLAVFVLALSRIPGGFLVNRYAALMGKVSFSAYLLHFAVLRGVELVPSLYDADATGYKAILVFIVAWPVVALLTFAVAWCSYHAIELPGMAIGKALIRRRRLYATASAS